MTRTQLQLPDRLYGLAKTYADYCEISMAEVFRNAIEMYMRIHLVDADALKSKVKWRPPVCRTTGLKRDPFADEDWRDKMYLERDMAVVDS
jgi:hypothetical protein